MGFTKWEYFTVKFKLTNHMKENKEAWDQYGTEYRIYGGGVAMYFCNFGVRNKLTSAL